MVRLLVLGLDCAEPSLVFEEWAQELPHLQGLRQSGLWGSLCSTIPPITVPAWTCMMTSQDPGMLGMYGFRNRRSYGYDDLYTLNATSVKAPTVWNHLSRHRLRSLVFGVPQTYPPRPLNGVMVACFLTPGKEVTYTYPPEVQPELEAAADGDYIIDVEDFRTEDKERLRRSIEEMTRRRFKAFRHFLRKDDWDLAMLVEMGPDRMQHGFWRFHDRKHRLYQPGNPYENVIRDYYRALDAEIGETLSLLDDETSVMVVSDHGAKTMVGAICINEWLQREGYLRLKEQPREQVRMKTAMIDWSGTAAWGEGGYYSRIFMNVQGREPQGTIPAEDYHKVREELRRKLEAMVDEEGRPLGTRAFKPEEIYRRCSGIPPDLVVYLGDLDWRSAGSVGTGSIYLYENDTGPDDANHAQQGLLIWRLPGREGGEGKFSIYDITPSILRFFGLAVPEDMIGNSII